MTDDRRESALEYHAFPTPGKLAIVATKPLGTQADLALAYSPGVAYACQAIQDDPREAARLTARGNLVGVITNGTAVLGLGAIGPLASKPVMEGKAVLFKKFAGIDVFDIEVDALDPDRFVEVVAALEPTFGAINLEDIKAPECFDIEARLRARMRIPVFHDDQHGTAIIVAAAVINGLRHVGKDIADVRLVTSGGGAAAIACLDLMVDLGLKVENVIVTDRHGVVWQGRNEEMDPRKDRYAKDTPARRLAEVIGGADVFLGLSAPGVLTAEMVSGMAPRPLIFALANPVPEIMPEVARAARPDAIIATGRSDYPNQVNNVLCFPFIFRGALDVGATTINEEMKIAAVRALADLAMAEPSDVVAAAYGGDDALTFGPEYIIPKPFDPRLILEIAPAVAKAAMDSGVATRPIADFAAYRQRLGQFVFRSGLVMKPVFDKARLDPKRIAYADGEDERVLRAAQTALEEGIARPIIIGRREVVTRRLERLGLRMVADRDFELVDPNGDPRFDLYWKTYHGLVERKGITPDAARTLVRTRTTIIAALMVRRGDADAMLCGVSGRYHRQLAHVLDVLGTDGATRTVHALTLLILSRGTIFITDPYVNPDPDAATVAEMAVRSAGVVRRFGMEPKVALLSHSSFGTSDTASARKMRDALALIRDREPELEVEGEMHGDAAMNEQIRQRLFPNSRLSGSANLLVMPNVDAANIAFNLLKAMGDGLSVGPMLVGAGGAAHVLTPTVTTRGILNMTAVAVVDAQGRAEGREAG
ncbi:malate dehydrogenase (oxaloacetate-decarboxylating)(NADP+) [Stella humosa]|uniref:Malate dehydrogenase (Oxaloacetate-decarboxylating)(NADP+) n=1 Tax=Stella humosa TaxID=94 RepID=A0A3N1MB74_9PROT|nr:NADP-dependent malic enzyme [Stella humosa]ROQ00509.1 malate dehydrogenase (oxaloacetate-decarboxylating)(NADP+) [Stella humosa]BBK30247.1 malic protein NAD-binding protein [Stella humosa]